LDATSKQQTNSSVSKRQTLAAFAELAAIVCIGLAGFIVTFSSHSYQGIADGMRYMAAGESLVSHGQSYRIPDGYKALETTVFSSKTYSYPSQLFQVYIGSLIHDARMSPNISTLAIANLFPFIGSLLLISLILQAAMTRMWSVLGTAFIALVAPVYRDLALHNATEPWMMLFGLATLWASIKQRYFLSGLSIGLGFFFRAQIISMLLAALRPHRPNWRVVISVLAGFCAAALVTWAAMRLSFPRIGESTSGFYGRVFFVKYTLSVSQAYKVIIGNTADFRLLFFSIATSMTMVVVARLRGLDGPIREAVWFFAWSTIVMVVFAFYMAGTVGDGVRDRYFLHLICFFWISLFMMLSSEMGKYSWPASVAKVLPLALLITIVAVTLPRMDRQRFVANLFAEDFPEHFFDGVSEQSVVLVGWGAPALSLHANSQRLASIPSFASFEAGKNQKADFIFLDALSDRTPTDWKAVWNASQFKDQAGTSFCMISAFDSPLRSSRLFRRDKR
jgi:hypothetical protein